MDKISVHQLMKYPDGYAFQRAGADAIISISSNLSTHMILAHQSKRCTHVLMQRLEGERLARSCEEIEVLRPNPVRLVPPHVATGSRFTW